MTVTFEEDVGAQFLPTVDAHKMFRVPDLTKCHQDLKNNHNDIIDHLSFHRTPSAGIDKGITSTIESGKTILTAEV